MGLRGWMTEAVLLGAITVLGYALAFCVEVGIAAHFGYPSYVISPTASTMAAALIVIFAFVPLLVQAAGIVLRKNDLVATFISLQVLAVCSLTLSGMMTLRFLWAGFAVLACGVFWLFALWFLYRRLAGRRVLGFSSKVVRPAVVPTVANMLAIAGVAVFSLAAAAMAAGGAFARSQKTFYMLKSNPGFAVVRMFGDVVVGAKLDVETGQFTGEYSIGKLGEGAVQFELAKVRITSDRPFRQVGLETER